jgi:uncharacterized coiled-coil DUF342 family protein
MSVNNVLKRVYKNDSVKLESQTIELGAIDDLQIKFKTIASKAPKIKDNIIKLANELDGISSEIGKLTADFKKLEQMAKELGADSVQNTAKSLVDITSKFSSDWGKASSNISVAAKTI